MTREANRASETAASAHRLETTASGSVSRDPGAARASTATWASAAPALSRGELLGRYIVLEWLGSGGMGVVYAAYDPELDRRVAIKLVRPDAHRNIGRARLLREAQAIARVKHPSVITVHDVGTIDLEVFVAMEFVEGRTLGVWLTERRRGWREVVSMFLRAGGGLAAAHDAGLVHRDFKPANVLVGADEQPRVLDFGLARPAPDAQRAGASEGEGEEHADEGAHLPPRALDVAITRPGGIVGTPAYMAPEQFDGDGADPRADQFAFCVALYEALYGERPYAGAAQHDHLEAMKSNAVRDAPKGSTVPGWVRAIVLRGLRANSSERHPSMHALLLELGRDPARTRRRALVGLGVVAAGALAVVASASARSARSLLCKGAEEKLVGVWDPARRGAIEAAFQATGKPYAKDAARAVTKTLDAYARGWASMETDACAATRLRGEQSDELLDLRMACLSERREDLKALVDLFANADGRVVGRAVRAAEDLPRLDECANATALRAPVRPPSDPAARRKVEAVRARLAKARALRYGGKYADAVALSESAVAEANAIAYQPLVAEARFELGASRGANGESPLAEENLRAALRAAESSHHDAVAARSWIGLVHEIGTEQTRYAEGHRAAEYAAGSIDRLGAGNELLRGELLQTQGTVFITEGKFEEARAADDEAVQLIDRAVGTDSPRFANAVNNRGIALMRLGRHEEACADFQRAIGLYERVLGPAHPDLAEPLGNLSTDFALRHEPEKSLDYDERSLRIIEGALGPTHPRVGLDLTNLCNTHVQLHAYDRALEECGRALAIYEASLGPQHLRLALPLLGLAEANVGAGHPEIAIPLLERALRIRSAVKGDPIDLAETNFTLARALATSGGDRRRARGLAEEARAAYAAGGEDSKADLAEVEAWLQGHGEGRE
jgi:serine/threonine protein kinase/tetratricopeptide (TPR) repeat protein